MYAVKKLQASDLWGAWGCSATQCVVPALAYDDHVKVQVILGFVFSIVGESIQRNALW